MIVNRRTIVAKRGHLEQVAKMLVDMCREMGLGKAARILVAEAGPFDQVGEEPIAFCHRHRLIRPTSTRRDAVQQPRPAADELVRNLVGVRTGWDKPGPAPGCLADQIPAGAQHRRRGKGQIAGRGGNAWAKVERLHVGMKA